VRALRSRALNGILGMKQRTKEDVRNAVWTRMEAERVAAFPGARGRIPNFGGAARAAEQLASLPEWARARTIKCNPDSPQRPVRLRALKEGKRVFMAVPRLAERKCFWELDPARIRTAEYAKAATIQGASRLGRPVSPEELPHIDLIVAGSVAVNRKGVRIGKGGGYSDLEYAIAREIGAVDQSTVVATTVHSMQLLDEDLPETAHDFRVDLIVTPEEIIRPRRTRRQPEGVLAEELTPEKRDEIPFLRARFKSRGEALRH
jgi:5-formyltetrahydrofolate cyclo-ligase